MECTVLRACDAPTEPIGSTRRYGPPPQPRLPLAPLLRQVELVAGEWNVCRFARMLGTNRTRLYQYGKAGIPVLVADRWAVRLGLHPANVWVEWFGAAS